MVTSAQYTVTPIENLLSDKQLLNGRVQYQPFAQYQVPVDPQHKSDLHTGIITTTCNHPVHGLMVRIVPDENTLDLVAGWYLLNRHVTGWAVIESTDTATPAAAADQPAVAVIDTPVAAEAPIAAQPAHMTDTGRYQAVVGYMNARAGYGYISDNGGGDIRFLTRNVLGVVALTKGMAVTYTTDAYTDCALTIVATGNAASEAAYTRLMDRKAATPAPRPRRNRDMNAQVIRPQA